MPRPPLHTLDPLVQFVARHPMPTWKKEVLSGLGTDTARMWWQIGSDPRLSSIRKVLDALGYDIVLVRKGEHK